MLERFLKSPLLSVIILIFLGVLIIGIEEGWLDNNTIYIPGVLFALFIVVYSALVVYNNKKHPDKKVKVSTYMPTELREEDEGMQWVTFKACRKVYIFYYLAIPIGIVLVAIFQGSIPYFSILLLVAFGIIQYLIYWFEIRKILAEGEE